MPRPRRPGWSPMTLTLSEASRASLRALAAHRGTDPGTVADGFIQSALAHLGKGEEPMPPTTREPAPAHPTSEEKAFYAAHRERISAMKRRFVTLLAKERRVAESHTDEHGETWRDLSAKERSTIGARFIYAAHQDVIRWTIQEGIPADQHKLVEMVLGLFEGRAQKPTRPPKKGQGGYSL